MQRKLEDSITALLNAIFRCCQSIHDLSLECKKLIQCEEWENLASKLEQRGILLEEVNGLHIQLIESKEKWDSITDKDKSNSELKWARTAKTIESLLAHISLLGTETRSLMEVKREEVLAKLKRILEGKRFAKGYQIFPHQKANFVDVVE